MKRLILLIPLLFLVVPAWGAAPSGVIVHDWTVDHAKMCQTAVMLESGLPESNVPIRADATAVENTAIANNFKIVSQSSACSAAWSPSDLWISNGIIGVGQHCDYSYATSSTYFLSVAASSTAPASKNLEFINPAGSDSEAIALVAGKFYYAWAANSTWDQFKARAALRQSSTNYPNWVSGQGFGVPNKTTAAGITDFDLFGPIGVTYKFYSNTLEVSWVNFAVPNYGKTYLVKFASEPGVNAVPADGTILYQGTGTTANYAYSADETSWFALFTEHSTPGTFSKCYSINKMQLFLDYTPPDIPALFFDSTTRRSIQDGLTWETAYNNFPSPISTLPPHVKKYLKASDIPYIITPMSVSGLGTKAILGGAIGTTGTDTTLGNGKSFITPDLKIAATEWSVYSGNTYYCTPASSPGSAYGFTGVVKNVFSILNGQITALTKGSDRDALTSGQWFYTDAATTPSTDPWKIYANWGSTGPPGDVYFVYYIDSDSRNSILYKTSLISTYTNGLQAQNIVFFGSKYGMHVNTTSVGVQFDISIQNCDFVFNELNGLYLQSWAPRGAYAHSLKFQGCRFLNNTGSGMIGLDAATAYGYTSVVGLDHIFNYCVFASNGGHGALPYSRDRGAYTNYIRFYFSNCLFFNNAGKGLYLKEITAGGSDTEYTVKNSISHNNAEEEFFADNVAGITLTAGYNCNGGGSYGGKWEANKGTGNVESDPLITATYGLQEDSPAVDAGTVLPGLHTSGSSTITGNDVVGNKNLYNKGIDMGARERVFFSSGRPNKKQDIIPKLYKVP